MIEYNNPNAVMIICAINMIFIKYLAPAKTSSPNLTCSLTPALLARAAEMKAKPKCIACTKRFIVHSFPFSDSIRRVHFLTDETVRVLFCPARDFPLFIAFNLLLLSSLDRQICVSVHCFALGQHFWFDKRTVICFYFQINLVIGWKQCRNWTLK